MRGDSISGERGGDVKRLRRWMFNFAVVTSLVMFLATCVLWVFNFWIGTTLGWFGAEHVAVLFTEKNLVSIGLSDYPSISGRKWWHLGTYATPDYKMFSGGWDELSHYEIIGLPKMGIGYRIWRTPTYVPDQWIGYDPLKYGNRLEHKVYLPHWIILIGTGVLPMSVLIRRVRRSRLRRSGCCFQCGYDLRATPERCPECGTAIPKPAENASHSG